MFMIKGNVRFFSCVSFFPSFLPSFLLHTLVLFSPIPIWAEYSLASPLPPRPTTEPLHPIVIELPLSSMWGTEGEEMEEENKREEQSSISS
jgi:hypothetical protein